MKNTNIETITNDAIISVNNNCMTIQDLEDEVINPYIDPDDCIDARTLFKIIDEQKHICKQQPIHSSENNTQQKTA